MLIVSNHIKCQYCVKKAIKLKWLKEHEKTLGEKAIKKTEFKVHQSKQQSQNRYFFNLCSVLKFVEI
jgi:hypothetical protein